MTLEASDGQVVVDKPLLDGKSSNGKEQMGAPAVRRAMRIMEYLAHVRPEASLGDISSALELNKSTALSILKALSDYGVVVRDGRLPVYRLGPKLADLGMASRRNFSYRALVKRELDSTIERFQVTCLLAQLLPNDAGIVIIDRIVPSGEGALRAAIGEVHPLSVPAMGRAVLATRSFAGVVGFMEGVSMGDSEELGELRRQLEQVRIQGYAASLEEYQEGVNSVATTVSGPHGEIALILCLLGSAERFSRERVAEAGAELHRGAAQLESVLDEPSSAYSR